jgi:mutator protein MutT
MQPVEVALAIIFRRRQLLICQRHPQAHMGGLWEFPGGKLYDGETPAAAAQREAMEETTVRVAVLHQLPATDWVYPDATVRLHPILCRWVAGLARPVGCAAVRWVLPQALSDYPFPPANQKLIQLLMSTPPAVLLQGQPRA